MTSFNEGWLFKRGPFSQDPVKVAAQWNADWETVDLPHTWNAVCMASLIKVNAKDNITGKDLLLFSNPNTTKGRNHITIKASLDGGLTWPTEHQVLLDAAEGWGYSCLSMIDKETVGIFYESSVAHMTFQAIKLQDLIHQ